MKFNITGAELNRQHHILKLLIDGKELTFFDTELGNPKDWKSKFEWDGRRYDIEYTRTEASHYVHVYSYVTTTIRAIQPIEIKISILDNLADDLGNLTPMPHVYGAAINNYKPKEAFTPKFKLDGHHPHTGKPFRFTEDENGEFYVNNIRCSGTPLEVVAHYETINP